MALTGCGSSGGAGQASGSGSTNSAGSGHLDVVKVNSTPIIESLWLSVGEQKGIFAKHHIKIERSYGKGGTSLVPGLLHGTFDVGTTGYAAVVVGVSKGLPLKVIAPEAFAGGSNNKTNPIMVKASSSIKAPKDLEGRKVAINVLESNAELVLRNAFEKLGVDASKVHFVEVPFPDIPATVESGRVDAGYMVEPFATEAKGESMRTVLYPYKYSPPKWPVAVTITTQKFLKQKPDVARRFIAAATEAQAYAKSHPDYVRSIAPKFTKVKPDIAKKMQMPDFDPSFQGASAKRVDDLMKKYGFIKKEPTLQDLFYGAALKQITAG